MFKSVTTFAAVALMSAMALSPANAGPSSALAGLNKAAQPAAGETQLIQKTGKKGKFAAGLIVGLGAATVLAHGGHGYYHGGYGYSHRRHCRRLRNRCWRGSYRACRRYDRRCY